MEHKRVLAATAATVLVAGIPGMAAAQTLQDTLEGDDAQAQQEEGGLLQNTTEALTETVEKATKPLSGDDGGDERPKRRKKGGDEKKKSPSGDSGDSGGDSAQESGPSGAVTGASTGGGTTSAGPEPDTGESGTAVARPVSSGGGGDGTLSLPVFGDIPQPSVAGPAEVAEPPQTLALPTREGRPDQPTLPILVAAGLIAVAMAAWKVGWDRVRAAEL